MKFPNLFYTPVSAKHNENICCKGNFLTAELRFEGALKGTAPKSLDLSALLGSVIEQQRVQIFDDTT